MQKIKSFMDSWVGNAFTVIGCLLLSMAVIAGYVGELTSGGSEIDYFYITAIVVGILFVALYTYMARSKYLDQRNG